MSNAEQLIATAGLEAFQHGVNRDTIRTQAKHIIAVEDCLRLFIDRIERGQVVDVVDLERAKRLCE